MLTPTDLDQIRAVVRDVLREERERGVPLKLKDEVSADPARVVGPVRAAPAE